MPQKHNVNKGSRVRTPWGSTGEVIAITNPKIKVGYDSTPQVTIKLDKGGQTISTVGAVEII
jgi:preprotein translocase subunit YajC